MGFQQLRRQASLCPYGRTGLQKKASFAAAGAADNQYIFVPGGLRVLGAAVHGKPFRLRQDNVVLKFGGNIGRDVLGVAP